MTNKKLTLGCPIRKLHFYAQSESHTESYKQNLDTFADSPSGYDHATVSTFIGWCPSFHYHLLLKLLNSIISPHPSSKSPKTDNCCFNSISLLPFHLCLLKISKAMSISSWRKMSLSRPMRWWMVSLVLWEYGAKVGETLKQGEEGGGGLYAIAWSATRALQGNLRLRAQTLCLLFAFLGERFHEISLCLTFIGGLLLSNSAPQN